MPINRNIVSRCGKEGRADNRLYDFNAIVNLIKRNEE
jgi:hypothetical protein